MITVQKQEYDSNDTNGTTIVEYQRQKGGGNEPGKFTTGLYFTIRSTMAENKFTGLIFSISGTIITGVLDKNGNPSKEFSDIVGGSIISFIIGEIGPRAGKRIALWFATRFTTAVSTARVGSIGGWVGAGAGFLLGFLFADSLNEILERASDTVADIYNEAIDYIKNPPLSISYAQAYENDGKIEFTITIPRAFDHDVRIKLETLNGSAKEGKDFLLGENTVTVPAGQTSVKKSIEVIRDGKYEGRENFLLFAKIDDGTNEPIRNTLFGTAIGRGVIIDFPEDKCPQPTHKNFDLGFNLPSSTSYGAGGGFGGAGGAGGGASWGIGSIPSISIPSKQPTPDIPYVECRDEPEFNYALTVNIPQEANNTAPANSNPLNSQVANENDDSDSCSDGMCVPNRSEQNPGSGNKDKAGFASNANNANSKQSGAALNLSGTTDTDKSGNKLYFDMNSDGFKERMLDWFGQDEGVLVNDTNRNGSEIIGNRYLNSKGATTLDTFISA